ncbi:MAG: glutamate--tRNA ligase [Planctomycetota bacterium]
MSSNIRVRFAPSPTGYMHIGNLRTALYNWLFARHTGGTFVLRIEDTDRQRHNDDAVSVIINGLKDLGLNYDEGPYFQSDRLEIYRSYAEKLVGTGQAYRSDRGEAEKGEAVILRAPVEDVYWVDEVKGGITFAAQDLQELVILKSDGFPTYNFACVIDDHEMGITHVLRGDDHVSNTPKQIEVYRALGWEPPHFGHFPMILGMDGQRLSKRHGAVKVTEFLEQGYLPHVILNFIALMGWSPGDDREIMSIDEMVELFTLDRVRPTSSRFDYEKFAWMNGHYIRSMKPEELLEPAKKALQRIGCLDLLPGDDWLAKAIELYRERIRTFSEFARTIAVFLKPDSELRYSQDAYNKVLSKAGTADTMKAVISALEGIRTFDAASLEAALREVGERLSIGFGKIAQPIRVSLTGGTASPEIFNTMVLAGKDLTIRRMKLLLNYIENGSVPIEGE